MNVCVRRILVEMYFLSKSGKWWTGSHRQWPPPPQPLPPLASILCLLHLSFRYLSTLSLSFALSIPKSLFSLDCFGLINLMLNLETYFSKSPGLEREKTTDKMASIIHVYHLLFISLKNVRSSQKFTSPFRLPRAAITFSVVQLNISGQILQRATFNWQGYFWMDALSFCSVGLYFIKLGVCCGSNTKPLPFKLQLWACHWV